MGGTCCRARNEEQVAKALLSLPWFLVSNYLKAVNEAEDILGRIPTSIEIFQVFKSKNHSFGPKNAYEAAAVTMSIYREDLIFSDEVAYQFTTRQHEGFNTFSTNFKKKFVEGYRIDKTGAIRPTTAKRINFAKQMEMLKSKDEALFEEARWIFDGDFRFLDGASMEGKQVGFTSFPRSGNSFLRRTIEQLTGITTGATMHLHTSTTLQI